MTKISVNGNRISKREENVTCNVVQTGRYTPTSSSGWETQKLHLKRHGHENLKFHTQKYFVQKQKDLKFSCKRCLCLRNADKGVGDAACTSSLWILTILWRIDSLFHKRLGKLYSLSTQAFFKYYVLFVSYVPTTDGISKHNLKSRPNFSHSGNKF